MKALIVAGESSGDIYGGGLASVLRARFPNLHLSGMGGDRMAQAGVELLYPCSQVAVVGVFEVFAKLRNLRQAYRHLTAWVDQNSPEFAVLIDFPDFNFRLAKFLKKKRIKTFYFISPQIWAWRKRRIHFLKEHVDLMVSILPFEKKMYDTEGIRSVYVGHPLVEIVQRELQNQNFHSRGSKRLIGLMPGSRETEVKRHLPILLETAKVVRSHADALLIRAPSLDSVLYQTPPEIRVVTEDRYAAMKACDFLIVASGTSTLEAAILGVPFLIVYRVGSLSWLLGKWLVRVPYYGLVNWIAQKRVIPEFIQNNMRPDLLARETLLYLSDQQAGDRMKDDLAAVVESLGPHGAMDRAADAIASLL
ncbi:lipid-A-disaccharide synthase [bacterium]|nr:lipid-A-disaccharide synthase [bacterium]